MITWEFCAVSKVSILASRPVKDLARFIRRYHLHISCDAGFQIMFPPHQAFAGESTSMRLLHLKRAVASQLSRLKIPSAFSHYLAMNIIECTQKCLQVNCFQTL